MTRFSTWAVLPICAAVACVAQAQTVTFHVPAGELQAALTAYMAQSGRQIVYRSDDVRGERSPGVQGAQDVDRALTLLLSGTGLSAVKDAASGSVMLVRRAAPGAAAPETIVVTATLRRTDLAKTPLAVTALTDKSLREQGAESLTDFFRRVPGLQVMDRGPNEKKFVMRGIQNDVVTGGGTVGVFVDEHPLSLSGAQLDLNLFDVERVEVLRGPQGTLYGASSMTGTIKYITRKADPTQFDAQVQAGLASTSGGGIGRSVEGMVNVPLVPGTVGLRAVAYKRHEAGFIDRVYAGQAVPAFAGEPEGAFFPGSPPVRGHDAYHVAPITERNANTYDVTGGRLSLQMRPTRAATITLGALTEDGKTGDIFAHQPDTAGDLKNAVSIRLPRRARSDLFSLTADIDLGSTALYLGATQSRSHSFYIEQFTNVFPAQLTPPGTELTTEANVNSRSEELRWRSNGGGRFNWLVGLWSYGADTRVRQVIQVQQSQSLRVVDQHTPSTSDQWAAFGELSFEIVPRLTATVGLRHWQIHNKILPKLNDVEPVIFFLDPKGIDPRQFRYDDKVNRWKFNLAWQADERTLVYLQAAQGFRPGGFNVNPTNDPRVPAQYKSDSLWNYELGAKGALGTGLNYAVSLFAIDWSDMQNRVFVNGAGFNGNAGRAHSRGIEAELRGTVGSALEWDFTGSYSDARLDEDAPADPQFPTGTEGKKGDRLPGVPKLRATLGAQTRFALGSGELVLRADVTHQDKAYTHFRSDPPAPAALKEALPGFTTTNLRATWRAARHWELVGFVNNVFDTRPAVDVWNFLGQPKLTTTLRPRTVGVRVSYSFE